MASEVDICNLALAHLGELPNLSSISPPEGSAHAEKCARFYPMARDVALESRNWSFALRRVALAVQANDAADRWAFRYALPANCMRAIAIPTPELLASGLECGRELLVLTPASADFVREGQSLYSNAENAELLYLTRVTDTTLFPPLFVSAVTWLLASYLAGPIARDLDVKNWCLQNYERDLASSAQSVANAEQTSNNYLPPWIRAR